MSFNKPNPSKKVLTFIGIGVIALVIFLVALWHKGYFGTANVEYENTVIPPTNGTTETPSNQSPTSCTTPSLNPSIREAIEIDNKNTNLENKQLKGQINDLQMS